MQGLSKHAVLSACKICVQNLRFPNNHETQSSSEQLGDIKTSRMAL